MTEPAEFDEKTTPAVQLAGKTWPIPLLAPRQLRVCRRQIIDVTEAIAPDVVALADDPATIAEAGASTGDKVMSLPNMLWERLMEVVFWGMTRAHPNLKWEEFLDLPITDADMFRAFLVVRKQSGVYTEPKEGAEPAKPGEVPAAR